MKKIFFIIIISIFYSKAYSFEIKTNFSNGMPIPKEHACKKKGGKDLSIPIEFINIPENTQSFALIIDDPDAVPVAGKISVHWVVIDIPPSNTKLDPIKKGKLDFGLIAKNSKGYRGFKGMCPPDGKHVYRIKGYALNDMIKKKPKRFTIEKFEKKYKDLILESFLVTGTYK